MGNLKMFFAHNSSVIDHTHSGSSSSSGCSLKDRVPPHGDRHSGPSQSRQGSAHGIDELCVDFSINANIFIYQDVAMEQGGMAYDSVQSNQLQVSTDISLSEIT